MEQKILSTARRPSFEGAEDISWADVDKSLSAFIRGYNKFRNADVDTSTAVGDLPMTAKRWISSKSLLGEASAETFADLIFFPVVNPGTNKINTGAIRAVLSGRGAQADIPRSTLNSARAMAERLLESEYDEESGKSVVSKVASEMRNMSEKL